MRKSIVARLLLLTIAFASIAADSVVAREKSRHTPRRTTVITLERTVCFGACPVYKLTICSDGRVSYQGIRFVKKIGKATSRISRAQLEQLVKEFKNVDYFNLDDSYTPGTKGCPKVATDMPSAVTSLTWQGKTKSINHYHGCGGPDALEELTKLENKIDEVVNTKRWIK